MAAACRILGSSDIHGMLLENNGVGRRFTGLSNGVSRPESVGENEG